MATEKEIIVTISSDGSDVDIDPSKGFKDGSCLKETLDLQNALGTTTSQVKKAEASVVPTVIKQTVGSK